MPATANGITFNITHKVSIILNLQQNDNLSDMIFRLETIRILEATPIQAQTHMQTIR